MFRKILINFINLNSYVCFMGLQPILEANKIVYNYETNNT